MNIPDNGISIKKSDFNKDLKGYAWLNCLMGYNSDNTRWYFITMEDKMEKKSRDDILLEKFNQMFSDFKEEIRNDMNNFKNEIKIEINEFKHEVNSKLDKFES